MVLRLFNSLTRKIEEFKPVNPPHVGVYTCGPTVYDYVSIGNWRTYVLGDLVVRVLNFFNYKVKYIMNITDVGHLTGDNLGDADTGVDRIEEAARRASKSAWDIARFYTQDFLKGFKKLNLNPPEKFTKATDYIKEQIALVKKIKDRGFAYKTTDGIYFDIRAYEKAGFKYGQLSCLDKTKVKARVPRKIDKKDPRDFALWKFSPRPPAGGSKRQMEWDSPWAPPGVRGKVKGFPGWHIECSSMCLKELGNAYKGQKFDAKQVQTIDIHIGGEDLRSTHHPNEIAQSQAATFKKPFVNYWLHGAFLLVDGGRMGRSLGNVYTLADIEKKGFTPLALRYFYLTGHYRKQLNFTWKALAASQNAYDKLIKFYKDLKRTKNQDKETDLSQEKLQKMTKLQDSFKTRLANDLNIPETLAIVWQVIKSDLPTSDKYDLLKSFDEVLGLDLEQASKASEELKIPEEVRKLIVQREKLREQKEFRKADIIRKKIADRGFIVKDTPSGTKIEARPHLYKQ